MNIDIEKMWTITFCSMMNTHTHTQPVAFIFVIILMKMMNYKWYMIINTAKNYVIIICIDRWMNEWMDGFPCFHVHPFFTIIIINDNDDDNGETKLNLIEYNEKQNEKKRATS